MLLKLRYDSIVFRTRSATSIEPSLSRFASRSNGTQVARRGKRSAGTSGTAGAAQVRPTLTSSRNCSLHERPNSMIELNFYMSLSVKRIQPSVSYLKLVASNCTCESRVRGLYAENALSPNLIQLG